MNRMSRHTDNGIDFPNYWECAACGKPSTEYTDHVLCIDCATGDDAMNDAVCFNFFSDTNQAIAMDELSLLSLDDIVEDTFSVYIGRADYDAMQEPIDAIMSSYGAEMEV